MENQDTLADLRSQIRSIVAEEKRLRETIGDLAEKRKMLELKACEIEFGVTIGSIVLSRDGVEHRVTSIDPSWTTPWLRGTPRKKDGSWGTAQRHLYSGWRLP